MLGAQILLKAIKDFGVNTIFGYPGGSVIKIYDELYKDKEINHILARHEQGATHMAEGYAKSTGKVGVVLATSGPGATNTVTGINDAFADSVPLVVITGQVKSSLIGTEAFQETNIVGITRSITKYNCLVKKVEDLELAIKEAFYIAKSGRPGPVLVDITVDVQNAKYEYKNLKYIPRKSYIDYSKISIPEKQIEQAKDMILKAKFPIIYAGGGVINSGQNTCEILTKFAEKLNIPVVLTLMGLGAVPTTSKNYIGLIGMHGRYESNMTMNRSDLIIALGARFSDRIIGDKSKFSPHSKIIHVDVDPSVIDSIISSTLKIVGDVGDFLTSLLNKIDPSKVDTTRKEWWDTINGWINENLNGYEDSNDILQPQYVVETISNKLQDKKVFVSTDVGQHQLWTAQFFKFNRPRSFLTSGGFGTMGFGLPSCIGAAIANPDSTSLLFSSEGSFMMNIQELSTAATKKLPIKIVLLNNARLGMVRQWQTLLFEGRLSETVFDVLPDFPNVAKAFGCDGMKVNTKEELEEGFTKMMNSKCPFILDVSVNPNANVLPMIVPGKAHDDMIIKI